MLSRREKKWLFCRHLIRYWCLMDFVSHWLFKQTSKSAALKPYFMWCTCLLKHKHVGKDNFQGEILVSTLPSCGSKVSKMHRGDAGVDCKGTPYTMWKVKAHTRQRPNMAIAYPGFNSLAWSTQEYCYSLLDGMLVYRRVIPWQYVTGTHLCTWVKRDKVE